jgi:hypothetical protein
MFVLAQQMNLAAESGPPCSLLSAATMHELNAYRCRDGNYLIAPTCIGLGGHEREGLLSYIGSVCAEQFGDALGAWILQSVAEHDFVRIPPAHFYSSALFAPSRSAPGGESVC